MEKEVIFREDLEKIFGVRTWDVGKDHLMINRGNENEATADSTKEETVEAKPELMKRLKTKTNIKGFIEVVGKL